MSHDEKSCSWCGLKMWIRTNQATGRARVRDRFGTQANFIGFATITPVDSAGGHRYWGSAKPCEWRASRKGWPRARLSNTQLTYPRDGDNLGKLRTIPDR